MNYKNDPLENMTALRFNRNRSKTMTPITVHTSEPMFAVWWSPILGPTGTVLVMALAQIGEEGRTYALPELGSIAGVNTTHTNRRGINPVTNGLIRAAKFLPELSLVLEHGSDRTANMSMPFVCSTPNEQQRSRHWGQIQRTTWADWNRQ